MASGVHGQPQRKFGVVAPAGLWSGDEHLSTGQPANRAIRSHADHGSRCAYRSYRGYRFASVQPAQRWVTDSGGRSRTYICERAHLAPARPFEERSSLTGQEPLQASIFDFFDSIDRRFVVCVVADAAVEGGEDEGRRDDRDPAAWGGE